MTDPVSRWDRDFDELDAQQIRRRAQLGRRSPTPSAQWCEIPVALHSSTQSPGSQPKSTREVVLPICSSGPGTTVPVDVTNLYAPSRCCAMPKTVTGPCLTSNSTDTPQPRLPW